MAFTILNKTVTGSSGIIVPTTTTGSRRSVTIWNNGTQTIFVGPASTVTAAAGSDLGGMGIPVGGYMTLDRAPNDVVFAIAASGSHEVRIMTEEGS